MCIDWKQHPYHNRDFSKTIFYRIVDEYSGEYSIEYTTLPMDEEMTYKRTAAHFEVMADLLNFNLSGEILINRGKYHTEHIENYPCSTYQELLLRYRTLLIDKIEDKLCVNNFGIVVFTDSLSICKTCHGQINNYDHSHKLMCKYHFKASINDYNGPKHMNKIMDSEYRKNKTSFPDMPRFADASDLFRRIDRSGRKIGPMM